MSRSPAAFTFFTLAAHKSIFAGIRRLQNLVALATKALSFSTHAMSLTSSDESTFSTLVRLACLGKVSLSRSMATWA